MIFVSCTFHMSCRTISRYLYRFARNPRAITEVDSRPEILDPFSPSPSSMSFFADFNFPSHVSAEETRPTRRSRPVSMGSWSNRFSFESSIFSISPALKRNSLSFQSSSFLNTGASCCSPPTDVSFLQLPRVSRATKRERKQPVSVISSSRASVYATTPKIPPTKAENRDIQPDILHPSVTQTLQEESPTRPSPQLPQFPTHSSHVCPLPLIPEDRNGSEHCITQETENRGSSRSASSVVPSLISVPVPVSPMLDRVLEVDDESADVFVERDQDSDERLQTSEVVGLGEEAPSSASDARVFFENQMEDVPKRVDWREFCIEVLDGHSDA